MSQRESKLSRDIMKALEKRGAFCFKVHGGPWMMSGLPDVIVCYRGRYLGLETKMPEGQDPTLVQELVHQKIRIAGGAATVVRSVKQAEKVLDFVDAIIEEGR